jgi:synaptic vesicle membrane protein VAT-1
MGFLDDWNDGKVFGQDLICIKNQLLALIMNILSWIFSFVPEAFCTSPVIPPAGTSCAVSIMGPGGLDQLQVINMEDNGTRVTVGCNMKDMGLDPPYINVDFTKDLDSQFDSSLVLVEVDYFSINYADVCIRWGLYESALRFVGFPIVPGFDLSGKIIWAGMDAIPFKDSPKFNIGAEVFGFSLFGSYSRKVLVPARQLRLSPKKMFIKGHPKYEQDLLAGIPAAAATALHAIALARAWPNPLKTKNKACLIHSAAGGVGSQLVQICKLQGFHPVVGVVGSSHKIDYCKDIGCDYIIDKSKEDLWKKAKLISNDGYAAIFDANGISTLSNSFDHVTRCGSLIVYGFHSNLPKASELLSPMSWIGMIKDQLSMPSYDPMVLTLESKTISGFNLSFFEKEHDMIELYLNQIYTWLSNGKLKPSNVTKFNITEVGKAHELIQSGLSKGKIVVSPIVIDSLKTNQGDNSDNSNGKGKGKKE